MAGARGRGDRRRRVVVLAIPPGATAHISSLLARRPTPAWLSGILGRHTAAVNRHVATCGRAVRAGSARITLAPQPRRRPPRPRRADQGAGGAGPGLGPERAIPRCARSFRMTAGSCRVAIRRSGPPQCGQARTSMAKDDTSSRRGIRRHPSRIASHPNSRRHRSLSPARSSRAAAGSRRAARHSAPAAAS